jgi:hypothetical protein
MFGICHDASGRAERPSAVSALVHSLRRPLKGRAPGSAALALALAVAGAGAVSLGPASAAMASPSAPACSFQQIPVQWRQSFFVPGNGHVRFTSRAGYVSGDMLHFRATGTTQIATWGDHKDPNGDAALAPDNGRWPAPGVRKYALIMRITSGNIQFMSTGAIGDARVVCQSMTTGRWYAAGTDSGFLRVIAPPPAGIEFEINDDNIGDNNDGPTATLEQSW